MNTRDAQPPGGRRAGLCDSCVHVTVITSSRGSSFYRCDLSFSDERFPRYPRLPVLACAGYVAAGKA